MGDRNHLVESVDMCPSCDVKGTEFVEQFLRGKLFRKLGSTHECLMPGRKEAREPLRGGLRNFL